MEITIKYKDEEIEFDLIVYSKYYDKSDFVEDVRAAFIKKLTEDVDEDLAEEIEEEIEEEDEENFIVTEEDLPSAFWFCGTETLTLADLKEGVFDNLDFRENEEEPFMVFLGLDEYMDLEGAHDKFLEAYYGEFSSEEAFARHYAEEKGLLGDCSLSNYIDWEAYWEAELEHLFIFECGYVFYLL